MTSIKSSSVDRTSYKTKPTYQTHILLQHFVQTIIHYHIKPLTIFSFSSALVAGLTETVKKAKSNHTNALDLDKSIN